MLPMNDEHESPFDALELRKMTLDCLEMGSVKNMTHKLDRLVNPDGEDICSSLPATNRRRVCRNVFTQGSLVWTCRNCQSDPTCVQCDPCFRRSNHIGHEVFFHMSSNEGCCDCGDLEAWAKEGCCSDHMPLSLPGHMEEESKDIDPLSLFPSKLVKRASVVICEVLRYVTSVVWDCSISYEATPDNLHSMSTAVDRRGSRKRAIGVEVIQSPPQQGRDTNEPASSTLPRVLNQDHICVRVHNDDIHSFAEVTRALSSCGCDVPVIQTRQIDHEGETLAASCDKKRCISVCAALRLTGLLVSTCRAGHIEREHRSSVTLGWLTQLSMAHDGFCRLVILELLRVRRCSSATSVKSSSVLHIREAGSELERIHNDRDEFADTTNTSLIVLLAADPLLTKQLRATAHGLYMHLFSDPVFKAEFGLGISLLYKHLTFLFSKGIGTSADSIFMLTVQIFTTPSLVKFLCDRNGETSSPLIPNNDESVKCGPEMKRMWVEGGGLVAVLFSSLRELIQNASINSAMRRSGTINFLDSPIVAYKRFSHVFKSCSYVLETNWVALDMLSGKRTCGQGVLWSWLNSLSRLQCIDMITRRGPNSGAADEYDSNHWLGAFALSLNVGSLSDTMMSSLVPKEGDEETLWGKLTREEAIFRVLNETASALHKWLQWNSTEKEYQVSSEPVSLHIPLHRFLSRALTALCSSHYLSKYHWFDLKAWDISPRALMEHPLRALVLANEIISAGLWVRNGSSVAPSALNYVTIPICKQMRDLDILLLQAALGSGCISHAEFIVILLKRFSILEWLYPCGDHSPYHDIPLSSRFSAEAYMRLAEEALTLIIQIVTEIPPVPTKENTKHHIKRELSHQLAAGCKMHSHIIEALCPMLDVTETEVTNIMYDISDVAQGTEGVQLFNLNAATASLYDPTFWHLSVTEHQVAEEKVAEILASELRNCDVFGRPVVGPPLTPHPLFMGTRSLLDCYVMSTMCNRILFAFVAYSDQKDHATMFNNGNIEDSSNAAFHSSKFYFDKLQTGWGTGAVTDNYSVSKPSVLLVTRVIHILTLQLHCCTSLPSVFKESVSILRLVSELEPSLGALYGPGLKWVISEYERRFENSSASSNRKCTGREFQYLDGGEDGTAVAVQADDAVPSSCITAKVNSSPTRVLDTAAGAKTSRARMMAFMARQAASFSKLLGEENDLEDDDESIVPASELDAESKESSPRCIMCHERSVAQDSLAFVGFAQRSTILSSGIVSNSQHDVLRRQYVVYAPQGCHVRSEFDVNSQKLAILPKGAVCTVLSEVFNGSVHIDSPIKGWATVLGCLLPLKKCAWREWGRARPHVALCGHAIHMKCWDAYFASIVQRCESDMMLSGQMGVNINRSEFLCPMCKRISNMLVPCIGQSSDDTETEKCKIPANPSSNNALKWAFAGNIDNDDATIASSLCSIESTDEEVVHDDEDGKEDNHPRLPSPQSRENMTADKTAALSILRHALLEGARKKSKCSYSALKRCAGGLLIASTPPWAPKREVVNPIAGLSLDHLMLLWCSLGFSLASVESAVRTSSKVPIEVPDIRPLGSFVSEAFTCFMKQQAADVFVNGLADMLEGRNIQQYSPIDPNACDVDNESDFYELSRPFVWDAEPVKASDPYKPGFVSKKSGIQTADCYGSGFYCCEQNTVNVIKFVPLPLLSWDLICLSSCVGSIAGPSAIRIMCIARLAQALIEPYMCLWGDVTSTTSEGHDESDEDEEDEDIKAEVKALSYLRSKLAESAGLAIHPRAPTGTCLSDSIRKAITPFYRTVVLLTETMCNGAISLSMCHLSANDCLHSLGLPNLKTLASNPCCIDLSMRWGQQYRHMHSHTEAEVVNTGLASIPLNARQPSPGNGSINFIGPPLDVGRENMIHIGNVKHQYESSDDESECVRENISENSELVNHSRMFQDLMHNLGITSFESGSIEIRTEEDNGADFAEARRIGRSIVGNASNSLTPVFMEDDDRERAVVSCMRANDVEIMDENTRNVITKNRSICLHHHGLTNFLVETLPLPSLSSNRVLRSQAIQNSPVMGSLTGGIKPCRWESSELTTDSATTDPSPTMRLCDLSHLGVGSSDRPSLLGLPNSYVELYLMVMAVSSSDPLPESENAVCLICGEMVIVGSREGCTIHARHCGSGCGVFFLIQRCAVLLMRDSFAAFYGSMYVDEHGEEDAWVRRGRPLYLSTSRYATLCRMYQAHQVAEEVCRRRLLTNRVIRNGYF